MRKSLSGDEEEEKKREEEEQRRSRERESRARGARRNDSPGNPPGIGPPLCHAEEVRARTPGIPCLLRGFD
jgi:hypothetical protein